MSVKEGIIGRANRLGGVVVIVAPVADSYHRRHQKEETNGRIGDGTAGKGISFERGPNGTLPVNDGAGQTDEALIVDFLVVAGDAS